MLVQSMTTSNLQLFVILEWTQMKYFLQSYNDMKIFSSHNIERAFIVQFSSILCNNAYITWVQWNIVTKIISLLRTRYVMCFHMANYGTGVKSLENGLTDIHVHIKIMKIAKNLIKNRVNIIDFIDIYLIFV